MRAFQELDSYYQITKQAAAKDKDHIDLTESDKDVLLKAKVCIALSGTMTR